MEENDMAYYDGTKLMSLNDIDGQKPELYICTTNRTGGKTTFFSRYCTKRFINNGEKFALFYRFANEMGNVADQFFKDIGSLFFPDYDMTQSIEENGKYIALYLNGINCGYALPLNLADQLKRYSHYFSDVQRIFFDEFQTETNHYCTDEVEKFLSLHTTIARGQGKQRRYVPCYLTGNPVTLLNPYYTALGISSRLNINVKFLKGHGL